MKEKEIGKFGALLKLERKKAGVSQREVAQKSGITQSTISHLESDNSNCRISTLERYAAAIGKKLNLISKDAELFHYKGTVQSVYDGDTCRVDIDLGLGIWVRNEKLRLVRINAPAITGTDQARGTAARDFLRELIDGQEVLIESIKDPRGKDGCYLAEIWLLQNGYWININDALVAAGHADYQED